MQGTGQLPLGGNLPGTKLDKPPRGNDAAIQHANGRGFASTVGAKQPDNFPWLQGQANAFDYSGIAVLLPEVIGGKGLRGWGHKYSNSQNYKFCPQRLIYPDEATAL
jgi:hypothetical protein